MRRKVPLPRGWTRSVRSSVLHILTLSHGAVPAAKALSPRMMEKLRPRIAGIIDELLT